LSRNERAESPRNPGVAFEPRDADVRALLYIGIGILVAAVVIHLAVLWLYGLFAARESRRGLRPSTAVPAGRLKEPPEPRLQVEPSRDLEELQRAQGEKLRGYDWADQKSGTVRIPIERAMDLLVQRGLPQVRQQPTTTTNAAGQTPTTSAAGQSQNTGATGQEQTVNVNAAQAGERGTTAGAASGRKAGKKQQ
jgi:hypothetical protein